MQLSLLDNPIGKGFESLYRPRDYQQRAIRKFYSLIDGGSPGAIVRMPTGSGKTFLGTWIADEWTRRGSDHFVMILAHERQLVSQFAEEVEDLLGERPGLEMSTDGRVDFGPRAPQIIVASRATLGLDRKDRSRLYKFNPNLNWLVIFDEAHRYKYGMTSTQHIVDHFEQNPNSKRLGLTATPERGDGVSLERLFPDVALDYRYFEISGGPCAVNDGWAVEYDQRFVHVHGVDFKKLNEVAGDFDKDELEAVLSERETLLSMVKPTIDYVGDRQTIVFNPTVNMAKWVAHTINEYVPGGAQSLDGSCPDDQRRDVFRRHQRGEFQFLSVCGLCREGYNDPNIGAVAVFRPTKSRSLAEQMKGRGCRPLRGLVDGLETAEERRAAIAASEKPNCMIVDLVGVSGLPAVATTAHLLATGKPDAVIDRANKNAMEADGPVDMAEEITKAEKQIADEEAAKARREREEREAAELREAERRAKLKAEVSYSSERVSMGKPVGSQTAVTRSPAALATERQIAALVRMGVPRETSEGYSKRQASAVIASMRKQKSRQQFTGQATERQRHVLEKHGYRADVSAAEAARIIVEEINPKLQAVR